MGTRETVRAFYDAVESGDGRALFSLLADDVVVSEPSFLTYGGVWKGHDGMKSIARSAAKLLDVRALQIRNIVVEGDRAFISLTMPRLGVDETLVIVEELVVRNDKITELTVYMHDAGTLVKPASPTANRSTPPAEQS